MVQGIDDILLIFIVKLDTSICKFGIFYILVCRAISRVILQLFSLTSLCKDNIAKLSTRQVSSCSGTVGCQLRSL